MDLLADKAKKHFFFFSAKGRSNNVTGVDMKVDYILYV